MALRNGARAVCGGAAALLVQDKFHGLALGHWGVLAWAVFIAAGVILLATWTPVAAFLPRATRRTIDDVGAVVIWPPERRTRTRRLYRDTVALADDIRVIQSAWDRTSPVDFQRARAARDAIRSGVCEADAQGAYEEAVLAPSLAAGHISDVASVRERLAAVLAEYVRRDLVSADDAEQQRAAFSPHSGVESIRALAAGIRPAADRLRELASQL